ncbi:FAD-binding oxidoreductase [Chitinophagales bacterium]|nr:FAD-binding oxidoreductase [Chitinophagales bacterium]
MYLYNMLSYWEKTSLLNYDIIIVGGGIVGLSTACALLENNTQLKVAVLDRSIIPTGASSRNAGFACVGSVQELEDDLVNSPASEVAALVEQRYKGLLALRKRLGDDAIGYLPCKGFELLFEGEEHFINKIDELNKLLEPVFGQLIYREKKALIPSFGFSDRCKNLIENSAEGQIHTGKMMSSLLQYSRQLGVAVFGGCLVDRWEEEETGVTVIAIDGVLKEEIPFRAKQIVVCTNAFSKNLLPDLDLNPGRGQVLITKPIPNLQFEGVFHYDAGYYYFRNLGDRIILGGGRNLDFEAEQTCEFGLTDVVMNKLLSELSELIIPNTPFEIEHQWAGIMGFGAKNKQPVCRFHSDRVLLGLRLGGMGVAIGSQLGNDLATMVVENPNG